MTLVPGWKNLDPGSEINIPDPQHCFVLYVVLVPTEFEVPGTKEEKFNSVSVVLVDRGIIYFLPPIRIFPGILKQMISSSTLKTLTSCWIPF